MTRLPTEAVVCGAGIAGIAAAYHLAQAGLRQIVLVDAGEPLSLTSDKSTECYRNFWPGPDDGMVRLVNRSLDLLEALAATTGNAFHLNRRGYLYATADSARLASLGAAAQEASTFGAGPLRVHPGPLGYHPEPAQVRQDGFDLITSASLLHDHFPFLSDRMLGALHVRRAGWFSAQQLGQILLDRVRDLGAQLIHGEVVAVETSGNVVHTVQVASPSGSVALSTPAFINAAGPLARRVAGLVGCDLPVECELHAKVSFADPLGAMPRAAPLLILVDPQRLDWTPDQGLLLADSGDQHLLEELPGGVHARPEGPPDSPVFLALWPYHTPVTLPSFPLTFEGSYPDVVLRGLKTLLPAVAPYLDRMPRPFVDGGYYTRTRENRPLVGPLGPEGSFVIGALSGFGLMAAMGAGELVAQHVTGGGLPEHARCFLPARYDDPAYRALLDTWQTTGQL